VAFSLFGKKPPSTPLANRPAARPAAKPAPAAAQADLASLDFTQPGEIPSSIKPKIEVCEAVHQVPAVIEQAAMLYSIEQTEAAAQALAVAIGEQDLGDYAPRAWGMLFELYQMLRREQDFDQLAVAYAAKFESSPPTWIASDGDTTSAPRATASRTSVNLAGVLNAKAQEPLKQLFRITERNPSVRLELGKVTDADEQGCALLNNIFWQMKRAGKECVLGGADKLAAILARKIAPGQRTNEQAWLLLLHLYQQLSSQDAFEEMAVNYAVTFEVSPPSFEPVRQPPTAVVVASEPEPAPETEEMGGCMLEGSITAVGDSTFAAIRDQAETTSEIVVDVSRLRRMDFVAAANLMNLVNALAAAQKTVRLVKASHLVTALWEVIGLDRVAAIETRKA
jgi:anti-anti-sigma regulatory factor